MRSFCLMLALGAVTLAAPTLACAASAQVEAQAPGRVIFAVAGGRVGEQSGSGAALPQGGAILAGDASAPSGIYLARVSPSGALDPSFGSEGIVSLPGPLAVLRVLPEADGEVLVVAMRSQSPASDELGWGEQHPRLVVLRLSADGALDRSYGVDGEAEPPIEAGCRCEHLAALQGNGELVLTGQDLLGSARASRWTVVRLTSSGALDASFGEHGVAVLPGAVGVGLEVGLDAQQDIVLQGQIDYRDQREDSEGPELMLTRLTPDGAPDPAFAHGSPFVLPVFHIDDSFGQRPEPDQMLVRPDGSVIYENLIDVPRNPPRERLGLGLDAYNPAGEPDSSFGSDGTVDLHEYREPLGDELVSAPGEGILAVHRLADEHVSSMLGNPAAVPGVLQIERIDAAGALEQAATVAVAFGGGEGETLPLRAVDPRELQPTVASNSFLAQYPPGAPPQLLEQPGGSYLLPGTVSVQEPAPRGGGRLTARFALVMLTPSFALDSAFAGAGAPMSIGLALPAQTVPLDATRGSILVDLATSAPGLCQVAVSVRGHLIARRLLALFQEGRQVFAVGLTPYGRSYLHRHRHVRVDIRASARDLLASAASATATGSVRGPTHERAGPRR